MNTLEKAKLLPKTKDESKFLEDSIVNEITNCDDPLQLYATVHNLQKILENALKNEMVKEQVQAVVDLYPEKTFYIGTFEVQKKTRNALDYSVDMEYNKLKAAVKARETFLKANKCNEDGEMIPDKVTEYLTIVVK